jgi:multidrug efflux pump subunit AcrA (membrane-fusion protein)
MPALTTAQAELDEAKEREQQAKVDWDSARLHADSLRGQLTSGRRNSVTPTDLAAADAQVEFTRLALEGARAPLTDLAAALGRAKADALCDEVVTMLPVHGSALLDALDGVKAALVPVPPAANTFDEYVAQASHRLEKTARALTEQPLAGAPSYVGPNAGAVVKSPFAPDAQPEPERPKAEPFRRLNFRHLGQTTVDRVPVVPCRGAAQLAAVVLPTFVALGASSALIDHLKQLAASAPTIPTV